MWTWPRYHRADRVGRSNRMHPLPYPSGEAPNLMHRDGVLACCRIFSGEGLFQRQSVSVLHGNALANFAHGSRPAAGAVVRDARGAHDARAPHARRTAVAACREPVKDGLALDFWVPFGLWQSIRHMQPRHAVGGKHVAFGRHRLRVVKRSDRDPDRRGLLRGVLPE